MASLFGPFSTGDYIGWNGDITLNYNAELPLYGAPSLLAPCIHAWIMRGPMELHASIHGS